MAHPLGRRTARPSPALAVDESAGLSTAGRYVRRSRQVDSADASLRQGPRRRHALRPARASDSRRRRPDGRRAAGARMEWQAERVMILEEGFAWNGQTFGSLSQIAKAMTGTNWNGHRFFGLRQGKTSAAEELPQPTKAGRSLGGIAGSGERTVGTSERVTLQL